MSRTLCSVLWACGCTGTVNDAGGDGNPQDTDTEPEPLPECHPNTVDVALCDPSQATFSLASTNPWYPLVVGSVVELAGDGEEDEAGIHITVTRTVLAETETILGVDAHILRHETYFDGVIHEIANNFYVEGTDGTVCYFGEDVEFFDDNGVFVDTHGTWKAGESGAQPGVIMPAEPQIGDAYYQEFAPGIALDQGEVTADDLTTTLAGQDYETIQVIDTNPIDDEAPCTEEEKRYAYGIGEVKDTVLEIVAFTPGP